LVLLLDTKKTRLPAADSARAAAPAPDTASPPRHTTPSQSSSQVSRRPTHARPHAAHRDDTATGADGAAAQPPQAAAAAEAAEDIAARKTVRDAAENPASNGMRAPRS
jgi:hypothetical protein